MEIEQKLNLKNDPEEVEEPDWYTLTETSNAILNELIAYTTREEVKERQKNNPDQKNLEKLHLLFEEVHAISREPDNFKSVHRMQEIIEKYAPMLRAINMAA